MTAPSTLQRPRRRGPDAERGSAMIIALMVMIILTLVGVTFLVLSEQEERISINQRDHVQALYVAEAAVEIAKTWFNDPTPPPDGNALKPDTTQINFTLRRGAVFKEDYNNELERTAPVDHPEVDASLGATYTGGIGTAGGSTVFEKPYRGPEPFTLWGRRDHPDVLICSDPDLDVDDDGVTDCSDTSAEYLDELNQALLVAGALQTDGHRPRDLGTVSVEQIRVYRPPLDFTFQQRYGVATIEAVAVKRVRGRKVTERVVREVLQEIPFPGPAGAIETEGEIVSTGSQGVHWGQVVSSSRTGDDINLPNSTATSFPSAAVPRSSAQRWGFHHTMNPASWDDVGTVTPGTTETVLTALLGITVNNTGVADANPPWIADPWLLFKARQNVVPDDIGPQAGEQPWPFRGDLGEMVLTNGGPNRLDKKRTINWSHMWQDQPVRFPPIEYETWKQVAQSGQKGMHYYIHDTGDEFVEDGIGDPEEWTTFIDINQGAEPGVHFFDSTDETDPALAPDADMNGFPDNLTPEATWLNDAYAEGFIFVNSVGIRTSAGASDALVRAKQPGEPFLDDGIELHDGTGVTDNCICIRYDEDDGCVLGIRPIGFRTAGLGENCRDSGNPDGWGPVGDACRCPFTVIDAMDADVAKREADTFRNGVWDIDLDDDGFSDGGSDWTSMSEWSTFAANNTGDGIGDGHGFAAHTIPHHPFDRRGDQGGNAAQDWRRDPRFANDPTIFPTRQPHEPFLNLDYKTDGASVHEWTGGSNPPPQENGVRVNYRASGDYITDGSVTTRGRDATGAAMDIDDIGVNGVLFNEGEIRMVGNLKVYGSLAIRRGFTGSASVDIWFNEDLVKGAFPPPEWNLPRVFASARETN